MTDSSGALVVLAMDLMGKDVGMGTVLATVSAKRLGVSVDEFQQGSAESVRKDLDVTRKLVFGDPDDDPTPGQANG